MNKSVEIIFKLVIAFVGFYAFYRFFIPMIVQFMDERKKKKNSKGRSLDQLIREQEVLLRKGMEKKANKAEKGNKEENGPLSIDLIIREYKIRDTNQENNDQDFSLIIELFENLQWGESSASQFIIKDAFKLFHIQINSGSINKIINEFYSHDFFQNFPSFEEINNFLVSFIILQSMTNEVEAKDTAAQIAITNPLLEAHHIVKGAHLLLIKNDLKSDFQESNYEYVLFKKSPVFNKQVDSKKKSILNTIFTLGKYRPMSPKFLIDKIFQESMIVMAVTPITINEKVSLDDAMTFFKIKNKHDLDLKKLNKIYKKFARICHPDKLSGSKLPKDLINISNSNFIKIKNAVDILKKEIKSKR